MDVTRTYAPDWVDRLSTALLALFGVSLRFAARVLRRRLVTRTRFAMLLQDCERKGRKLRFEGEDDETVARRIAMMEWLAEDPLGAARRLARQARGWSVWCWMAFGAVPRGFARIQLQPGTNTPPPAAPDSS